MGTFGIPKPTTATLGGVVLLANSPISWSLTRGTEPVQKVFLMGASDAEELFIQKSVGGGNPVVQLKIDSSDGQIIVNNLHVLYAKPTNHEDIVAVKVSDVRYLLRRVFVDKKYNIVRKDVGQTPGRVDGVGLGFQQGFTPELKYLPHTINKDKPYSAIEILADILKLLPPSSESKNSIPNFDIQWKEDKLRINNIIIKNTLDEAIERALHKIPGAEITLDLNGDYIIYDSTALLENPEISKVKNIIRGMELSRVVNLSGTRPKVINNQFVPEVELRLDGTEGITNTSGQIDLVNVAPCPDAELILLSGEKVLRGTYVPLEDLMAAWNRDAATLPQLRQKTPFTFDNIQKMWFRPSVLNSLINADGNNPNPIIAMRLATILSNYRTTWQMQKELRDRLESWKPYRLGFTSLQGSLADSPVFVDWHWMYNFHARTTTKQDLGVSFKGYSKSLKGVTSASPFKIQVIDQTLGVLSIIPRADLRLFTDTISVGGLLNARPGVVNTQSAPVADIKQEKLGGLGIIKDNYALEPTFAFSTIISAIPNVPNDDRRAYTLPISPKDVSDINSLKNIGECGGPKWVNRIAYNPRTSAWFAWDETRTDRVSALFSDRDITGYTVDWGKPINEDYLKELAKSSSAVIYEQLLDRKIGAVIGELNADIKMAGTIDFITHTLATNGMIATIINLPESIKRTDLRRYLPEYARQLLDLEVKPESTS